MSICLAKLQDRLAPAPRSVMERLDEKSPGFWVINRKTIRRLGCFDPKGRMKISGLFLGRHLLFLSFSLWFASGGSQGLLLALFCTQGSLMAVLGGTKWDTRDQNLLAACKASPLPIILSFWCLISCISIVGKIVRV